MGSKNITPGEKIARIVAARFIKAPKKGTPGIEIAFKFNEPSTDTPELMNWVGWLTPPSEHSKGALENTMRTLVEVLEFNGNDSVDANGVLTDPNAFNMNKDVQLVVEFEVNPNDGKSWPKIKWVNNVGGSAFQGLAPETVKSDLASIGFKAAYLAAKQSSGPRPQATQVVSGVKAPQTASNPFMQAPPAQNDIPF